MSVRIIVAYDLNRCIGNGPKLPWHISGDMKWFKDMTAGCPIIMGRKTWESLTVRPLPYRKNIILSKDRDTIERISTNFPSVEVAGYLDGAIALAKTIERKPWIIGGAELYREALMSGLVDEVVATEIGAVHDGDIYFPALPVNEYVTWNVTQLDVDMPNCRVLHFNKVCRS